jgi:hypothetical protein
MKFRGERLGAALLLIGCSSSSAGPATPSGTQEGGTIGSSGAGTTGSSGSSGSSGTGTTSCAGSPVVWKDDGVTHCASTSEAILSTNTTLNPLDGGPLVETSLELVTTQGATAYTFGFIVTSSGSLGGSYDCTPSPTSSVEITDDDIGVYSTTVVSCDLTVTLTPTDAGATIAAGTFSALLKVSDGGTKMLTDGTFNLPVTPE